MYIPRTNVTQGYCPIFEKTRVSVWCVKHNYITTQHFDEAVSYYFCATYFHEILWIVVLI